MTPSPPFLRCTLGLAMLAAALLTPGCGLLGTEWTPAAPALEPLAQAIEVRGRGLSFTVTVSGIPTDGPLFDPRDYGATPNDTQADTAAVQAAIDAAAAAGGGRVQMHPGLRTGSLRLKSGVYLVGRKGASLTAIGPTNETPDANFPVFRGRWEGQETDLPSPLILIEDAQRCGIVGPLHLDAQLRAIVIKNSSDVRLQNLTLRNRNRWTLQLLYSRDVLIDGVNIQADGSNADGIDPDSSQRVVIRRCDIDTTDDSIAIKSGENQEGRRIGRPSGEILIEHCRLRSGRAAVAIGSEMSGGVENVLVRDCLLDGKYAFRLKTGPVRGGYVRNVFIHECDATNWFRPLKFELDYAGTEPVEGVALPVIENIVIDDLEYGPFGLEIEARYDTKPGTLDLVETKDD